MWVARRSFVAVPGGTRGLLQPERCVLPGRHMRVGGDGRDPARPRITTVDLRVRAMDDGDWVDVRRIYAEGIATGEATFETQVASATELDKKWLPNHRWVVEIDGRVAGWGAASPTSPRPVYSGVIETSVYVGDGFRGAGAGRVLLEQQTTAADSDPSVWTLQTAIFPENVASLALHKRAGFRVVGTRERIGRLNGRWRDTIFLERRCETP